jgi:hypothetical protein
MNEEEKTKYLRCMIAFGAVLTGFLFISGSILISSYRFKKNGKAAIACIRDKREYKGSTEYNYWVVIKGDSLSSEKFIHSSIDYDIGDSVVVSFLLDDPTSVKLKDDTNYGGDILILCSTFSFGILFSFALIFPEAAVQYFTGEIG